MLKVYGEDLSLVFLPEVVLRGRSAEVGGVPGFGGEMGEGVPFRVADMLCLSERKVCGAGVSGGWLTIRRWFM